jgi:hypothetical protein
MSSRTIIRKFAAAAAWLLLAVSGLMYAPDASAQNNSSSTNDAAKKYCTAKEAGEWKWYWHYGSNPEKGPFESESAALAHLQTYTLQTYGVSWCTLTFDHMNYDTTPHAVVRNRKGIQPRSSLQRHGVPRQ